VLLNRTTNCIQHLYPNFYAPSQNCKKRLQFCIMVGQVFIAIRCVGMLTVKKALPEVGVDECRNASENLLKNVTSSMRSGVLNVPTAKADNQFNFIFNFIVFFNLFLGLPCGLFPSGFPLNPSMFHSYPP
jgi:hypothetical protein